MCPNNSISCAAIEKVQRHCACHLMCIIMCIMCAAVRRPPLNRAEGGNCLSVLPPSNKEGKPNNLNHLGDHHHPNPVTEKRMWAGGINCPLQGNEALACSSVDTGYLSRRKLNPDFSSCSCGWTRERIIIMKWGEC